MAVYLIGFLVSALLLAFADRIKKNQRWFFVWIALLIPCCIAGFRADTIGVDVIGYLKPMTEAASSAKHIKDYYEAGWFYIWKYLYVKDYGLGFSLLIYVVTKVFNNLMFVQFFVQLFMVVPIYAAIKRIKDYPSWLCMLVYYLMFFNTSLNMMRQMIAMAFLVLAIVYLSEGNKKKYLIYLIVACLFHTSALMGLAVGFIYLYVQADSKSKFQLGVFLVDSRYLNMVLVVLGSILALLIIDIIVKILPMIGLSGYSNYISGTVHLLPNQFISRAPIFLLFILNWKQMFRDEKNTKFFFTMLCLDLISAQLASVNTYGGRIAYYFSEYGILSYPAICMNSKYKKSATIMMIAYMLFYWWFNYSYLGKDATIPYISMFR